MGTGGHMQPSRKCSHLEMRDGKSNQQRIWEALRNMAGSSSYYLVSRKTGIHHRTVKRYIDSLSVEGYLEVVGRIHGEPEFKLVRDNGVDCPRIKAGQQESFAETGQEIMWRTMRILGQFCASDLVFQAERTSPIKLTTAQRFLKRLKRAGYFDVVCKSSPGVSEQYRLRSYMNTGPIAPIAQRDGQVFDPNLNQVTFMIGDGTVRGGNSDN